MYADELEKPKKASIHDRLNGAVLLKSRPRRQIAGKRQRQDDGKWEHDLYKDDDVRLPNRRVGAQDLRLKLLKKSGNKANQTADQVISSVMDLRRKLSSSSKKNPPKAKAAAPEASKTVKKIVAGEAPEPEIEKVSSGLPKKKKQRKVESVDNFLHSLGLEKYSITFQAEEIDMTALVHMTEEDLKAVGIPMGPRKKILSAVESRA